MANIQFKITPEHKKLAEKYKGLGYDIEFQKDGIWIQNELEYHFIPVKTITLKGTIKNK